MFPIYPALILPVHDKNLTRQCSVCLWNACAENCFESHRDRYGCHNTGCPWHKPCPRTTAPDPVPEVAPVVTADSSNNTPLRTTGTATSEISPDGNLVFHERITRGYQFVNGQLVPPPPGQTRSRPSSGTPRATPAATPAASPVSSPQGSSQVDEDVARYEAWRVWDCYVSLEDINAQERMLEEFQRAHQAARANTNPSSPVAPPSPPSGVLVRPTSQGFGGMLNEQSITPQGQQGHQLGPGGGGSVRR